MYGYELYQQLTDPAGLWLVWRMKQSQLYALLGKLEDEGYIAAEVQAQESRPPRKVFHLTPSGLSAYQQWLETPVAQPRAVRQEFLAKLYFAREEGAEIAQQLIAAQRDQCEAWLNARRQRERATGALFEEAVHAFRLSQIQAILAWIEQIA